MGTDELVKQVAEASPTDDPFLRLGVAVALHHNLIKAADEMLDQFVSGARAADIPWQQIGRVLGVTRQAAHARFAERTAVPSAPPWTFRNWSDAARAALIRAKAVAQEHQSAELGVVHLLIALRSEPGPVADVLAEHGIEAGALAVRLPRGSVGHRGGLPFTESLKAVFAKAETLREEDQQVEPLQLVSAALDPEVAEGLEVLNALGVDATALASAAAHQRAG